MRNPVNAAYQCPFINSTCVKRSQRFSGSYPLCSIWHGRGTKRRIICMCPKRFFEANLKDDVIKHCWVGAPPTNAQVAYEVKMEDFGMVDFVVGEVDQNGQVHEFVSVELQAVDCTGSVEPAYSAVLNNVSALGSRISYGINWANVRKRYINQLILKGFYHHHWNTRIISVIQTPLYEVLHRQMAFDELSPTSRSSNIVFMCYDYQADPTKPGGFNLRFDKAVGTSHHSLMMASLYHTPPSKAAFITKIMARMNDT